MYTNSFNLVNSKNSSVLYNEINFSDGQALIDFKDEIPSKNELVVIESRTDWNSLQRLACSATLLKKNKIPVAAFLPYIIGGRSDRSFTKTGINYIKDVIAPLINNLNLEKVITLDPHSYCLEAGINNLEIADLFPIISPMFLKSNFIKFDENLVLVLPDEGAKIRLNPFLNFYKDVKNVNFLQCYKKRDANGRVIESIIPEHNVYDKDVLIIDDICDRGGTFIPLAAEFKKRGAKKIALYVTHSILPGDSVYQLAEHFSAIFTTNSVKNHPNKIGEYDNEMPIFSKDLF